MTSHGIDVVRDGHGVSCSASVPPPALLLCQGRDGGHDLTSAAANQQPSS